MTVRPRTGRERRKAPKASTNKPADGKQPKGAKQAAAIELMSRPEGATTKERIEATGWQAHTVRGFISGALKRKQGLTVEMKRESGVTRYWITGGRLG